MTSTLDEKRNKSARRKAQLILIGMPTVLSSTSTINNKYAASQKVKRLIISMMSISDNY
jgi:hypothetical protein